MTPGEFLEILKSRKGSEDGPVDIGQMRAALDQTGLKAPLASGVSAHPEKLGEIASVRFEPGDNSGRHILYFHGGGYCVGSPQSHQSLTSAIAKTANAAVWSVDYSLAPERPYPGALDDALASYRALLEQTNPPDKIFIAGDSAGGGLAVSLAVRARELGLPLPAGLILMSPFADLSLKGASHTYAKDRDFLVWHAMLDQMAGLYANSQDRNHPEISPIFADLSGLPDMLIHTGSEEVLLCDSTTLAERAGAAGVQVELKIWPSMPHVFQAYHAVLSEACTSIDEIATWIKLR